MSSHNRVTNVQLRKVHRYVGLFAAIWLLLLSITGIAINHSNQLKLDQVFIENALLLRLYGVKAPSNQHHFQISSTTVSQLNQRVYLGTQPVTGLFEPLLGVVGIGDYIVMATSQSLTLVAASGQIIDQLSASEFSSGGISRIGRRSDSQIAVETPDGILVSDVQLLTWTAAPGAVLWSESTSLDSDRAADLMRLYQGRELSVERLLLDLHSGRFFGLATMVVMDIAGILLLLMAVTGIWIWWRSQKRKRPNR